MGNDKNYKDNETNYIFLFNIVDEHKFIAITFKYLNRFYTILLSKKQMKYREIYT